MNPSSETSVRVDPLRGWTTRIAPLRGQRPHDPAVSASPGGLQVGDAQNCPFCPGNEEELGEILWEVPGRTRAVANRYPFMPEGEGWQEVLVDTPRHEVDLASMTSEERFAALSLYRERMRAAYHRAPDAEVHLFRNQGRDAGSSRVHPHGQLVAITGSVAERAPQSGPGSVRDGGPEPAPGLDSGIASPARRGLEAAQREAFSEGGCLLCRMSRGDLCGEYHVARGLHLAAWILDAPLDPGHLRIAPVDHATSFAEAPDGLLIELAQLLGALAALLPDVAGTSDHNLLFHDHGNHPDDPALHWHLELRPRVSRLAGFEQMSGTGVSSSDPARDAALLRAAMPFDFRP